ncbi:hypothetical protein [Virgibacillus pantothenticus]|uniref:hypothetical protein n=1 Tax=Virgibacillus pantothenticus TaxID=1473 RepID=UPI001BB0B4D8|nr:hypothetical protein [Virgibacillus pantothenticus]
MKKELIALINYLNSKSNRYKVIKDVLNEQMNNKNYGDLKRTDPLIELWNRYGCFLVLKLEEKIEEGNLHSRTKAQAPV